MIRQLAADTQYAGSLVFMLADSLQNRDNCEVADRFFGLYASGRRGCGGTFIEDDGELKNSGYRVCRYYHDLAQLEIVTPPSEGEQTTGDHITFLPMVFHSIHPCDHIEPTIWQLRGP